MKLSTYRSLLTIIESNNSMVSFFTTLFIVHMIQNFTKYILGKLISTGMKDLFIKVVHSVVYNKMEYYGDDIQNKITNIWQSLSGLESLMEKIVIDLPRIITFICYYIFTISQIYPNALYFIIPINFMIIFALHQFSRKRSKLQRKRTMLDIDVKNKLLETTSNIEFVKLNNREDHEISRVNKSFDKYIDNKIQDRWLGFCVDSLYLLFNEFMTVTIYLAGILYIVNNKMNPLTILYVTINTSNFCIQTMEFKDIIMKAIPKLEVLHRILYQKHKEIEDIPLLKKDIEKLNNNINFQDVTFSYHEGTDAINVIQDFSFEFKGNKINLLLGPNGSGKSTIVKLLLRLYELKNNTDDEDINQILFNGVSIKEYDLKDLRNKIFLVSNEPRLFDGTVMYNIKYGNEHITEGKIIELCDVIYSRDWLLLNKNKLVGFKGKHLSGSEKKKVQLINALCRDAEVLIFDEPTNTLDSTAMEWFNKFVKLLRDKYNKTIIIITHDLRLTEISDHLIKIK
jgi:ABC-type multidrug transport system fused ATPase/permease subunit